MSTPFIEMPQRAAASPWTTSSPPCAVAPADWLTLPSTTTRPRHHVLGDPRARVATHAHRRVLVHARAVVADVPVDLDLELGVEPTGDGVRAPGIDDPPPARALARQRDVVEALVQLAQRRDGEVDDLGVERRRHATAARSQT